MAETTRNRASEDQDRRLRRLRGLVVMTPNLDMLDVENTKELGNDGVADGDWGMMD